MLEELTNFVPRPEASALVDECFHERIHNKPPRKNNYEADGDILENFDGATMLSAVGDIGEVKESSPRKKHRRQEHGDVNARVEDVLRNGRKVTDRLASAYSVTALGYYRPRKSCGRHHDRGCDEKDNSEEHRCAYDQPVYH